MCEYTLQNDASQFLMNAQVKIEQLEGRDHFVIPVVLLTQGIFNGSRGRVLYMPNELRASAAYWNSRPIVVYHPSFAGATSPQVYNQQKVGTLFNTRFEDGKLKADAWIDQERVRTVDDRVYQAIQNRQPLEVSTGFTSGMIQSIGFLNNKRYDLIVKDIRPDHLAILPDQKGACSIDDGCGMLTKNQSHPGDPGEDWNPTLNFQFTGYEGRSYSAFNPETGELIEKK